MGMKLGTPFATSGLSDGRRKIFAYPLDSTSSVNLHVPNNTGSTRPTNPMPCVATIDEASRGTY